MEAEIWVQCRKSDEDLIADVLDEAVADYQKLMADNVKKLAGREPPCKAQIDTTRYLPEFNSDDVNNSW
jgi:hypothetical protein